MDQAELDKSMKLLELVENNVGYVVASSYLPDSASTPVKGVSNISPRRLISHIRARIAQSIKAENKDCFHYYRCHSHYSYQPSSCKEVLLLNLWQANVLPRSFSVQRTALLSKPVSRCT